jgi:hypothetical protein
MNLGSNRRCKNFRASTWSRNSIDRVLIHEQLGISKEGAINATNAIFEEAKIALKKL